MSGTNTCRGAWRRLCALLLVVGGIAATLPAPAQAQVFETSGPSADSQVIASGVPFHQSFSHDSAGPTYAIGSIALQLVRDPAASLQTVTVTLLSGAHNGTVIDSATLSSSTIPAALAWRTFDFSGTVLTDNQVYFLRIESSSVDGLVRAGIHNADVYPNGAYHSSAGIPDTTRDVAFQVLAPNSAPIAVNDAMTVLRGTSQTVLDSGATSVLANDNDAEGDVLTAAVVTAPLHGMLTLNPNGTFNYVHGGGAGASDSFTYEARDATGTSAPATVTIAVSEHCFPIAPTPCSSVPVGPLPGFALDFDAPAGGLANSGFTMVLDPTVNRYPMVPSVPTLPGYEPALIARTGGKLVLTSTRGSMRQTQTENIGNNTQVNALGVGVQPTQLMAINVTLSAFALPDSSSGEHAGLWFGLDDDNYVHLVLVNRAGAGLGDIELRREIGGVTSGAAINTRLAPVSNLGGATIQLALRLDPATNQASGRYLSSTGEAGILGPLSLPASFFTGQMLPDATTGPVSYAGVLTSSRFNAGTALSFAFDDFSISGVGQPPVAVADGITVARGASQTVLDSGATSVLANDTDAEGDALTAVVVASPANGTLTLNPNGTFTYTHDGSATGSDSFTYRASDGLQSSNIVTVAIDVYETCVPLSLAPCATVPVAVSPAAPFVLGFDATAGGLAGTGFTAVATRTTLSFPTTPSVPALPGYEPANLALTGGRLVITSTRGTFNTTSNSQVNGLAVGVSIATPFEIGANLINAPFPSSTTSNEQSGLWFGLDQDNMVRLAVNNAGFGGGVVELRREIAGVSSGAATDVRTSAVLPVTGATITATMVLDPVTNQVSARYVSSNGNTGVLGPLQVPATFFAGQLLPDGSTGPVSLAGLFASSRNNATTPALPFTFDDFRITVLPVAPTAVPDGITVAEGGVATTLAGGATSVLANDTDVYGDPLTAEAVAGPTHGTLTLDPDGTFVYVHDGSETTSDSFTYRARNTSLGSSPATVTITITPVNDAPVAVDDALTVAEGGSATTLGGGATSVLANDSDAEGAPMTAAIVTSPVRGSLVLNPDGTFVYIHDGSETTSDSVTYRTSDPGGLSSVATIHITVIPVNDAPVALPDAVTVAEGGTASTLVGGATSVLANDTDAENNALSAAIVSGPVNGSLVLNPNGTFAYIHDGSETTSDGFSYRANDGVADSNVVTATITITPVNDAPIAADDAYMISEDNTLIVNSATGTLANDTDAEGSPLTAMLVTGPAQGTLTFNPDGTFAFTPALDFNGPVTFTYRANDGTADSNTATVTITVFPVGDAPVGGADSYTVVRLGTLVVAAPGLLANDSDPDGDALSVASIFSMPARGSLTFGADGSFAYAHDGSTATSDSFVYVLADTDPSTPNVNVAVTLTIAPNAPPVAVADTIVVDEGATATVLASGATSVLANDTDVEGNASTAMLVTTVAHGALTLRPNGTFIYVHNGGEIPTDSFTYQATDGMGLSNIATVSIAVTPINDVPVAVADAITLAEGGTATALIGGATSVLANDIDAENDALHAVLASGPINGNLVLNPDGSFAYVHDGSETTSDSFSYHARDASDDSNPVTVTITVTPVNDAPVAANDAYSVDEDTVLTVTAANRVTLNDTDAENQPLTAVLASNPTHGSLTLAPDGTFTYLPSPNYNGSDVFTYRTNDGSADSNPATVTITVNPIGDAPVGSADAYSVVRGDALTVAAPGVLGNDIDPDGDALSVAGIVTMPAHGILVVETDGAFIYVNDGNAATSDSFVYVLDDGDPGTPNAHVTVALAITANQPPVAVADALTVAEGGSTSTLDGGASSVLSNDTDAEGDPLVAVLVTDVVNGSLVLNADGSFSYSHDGSETTSDSFTYRANDDEDSNLATVTIAVTPVNDAPVAVADAVTVDEGGTATTLDGGVTSVLANDSDIEADALVAVLVTDTINGALTLHPDGTFGYTHDGSETLSDSFSYRANDGDADSNVVTVTIAVTPANDAPSAVDDALTVAEGGSATTLSGGALSVLGNDIDAEDDALTAVLVAGPANGILTLHPDGTFDYTHDGSETTSDHFTYRANDGDADSNVATVTITVTSDNDAPVAVADAITVAEGGSATTLAGGAASVLANDTDDDGDTLSAALVDAPAHGTLSLAADGTFSYVHDGGETTSDTFTYRAADADTTSAPATVTITITPVNDAPRNTLLPTAATGANTALVLSTANGNAPRVDDVDAGANPIELTLTVSSGTLRLASVAGLVFSLGDGIDDASLQFRGTLAAINTALDGLRFDPASDSADDVTLTMTSDDLGHDVVGGALADSDTMTITVVVDVPLVTGVSAISADGRYGIGDRIELAVEFDRPVLVDTATGTPRLQLETGSSDAFAIFVPSPGTSNVLRFDYVVSAGDSSADLDHASSIALDANGATLRSASGGDAVLTLPAPGTATSIAARHAIVVDGIAPRVQSVAVPPPARYGEGDTLEFQVRFDEAVDVAGGAPRIAIVLDTGGTAWAEYAGGGDSTVLTFRYVVAAAHADDTGIALGTSIDANGTDVVDLAGNPASLVLRAVGATDAVLIGSGGAVVAVPLVVPAGGPLAWLALLASVLLLAGPALRRTLS